MRDTRLQDVVFASALTAVICPKATAFRAGVTPVSVLGDEAIKLEKQDLEAVRQGLLRMIEAGAAPPLDTVMTGYGPPPLIGAFGCVYTPLRCSCIT